MKKFLAMIMALALALALAVPVLADSLGSSGTTFKYGGAVLIPTVDVTCYILNNDAAITDTTLKLYLNPYGASYNNNEYSNGAWIFDNNKTAQILSAPLVIASRTSIPVAVSVNGHIAEVATSHTPEIKLLKQIPTTDKASATLDAFLYLKGESCDGKTGKYPGAYDATAGDVYLTGTAAAKAVKIYEIPAATSGAVWAQVGIGGWLQTNHGTDTSGNTVQWDSTATIGVNYTLGLAPAVGSAS